MPCSCLKDVKVKVTGYIKEKNPEYTINEILFENETLMLDTFHNQIQGKINYNFIKPKTNGEPSKPQWKHINMHFTHCPFCGIPYKEEEKEATQ